MLGTLSMLPNRHQLSEQKSIGLPAAAATERSPEW
jgi:hypothetical protein